MATDFREAMAAAVPAVDHLLAFHQRGSKHPPYNELGVADSFKKYCAEMLPASPLTDPRGKKIRIIENNFPKFLNLEPKKQGDPARAILLVRMLKAGTFDPDKYTWERDRIEDLFWVSDVIQDPDCIYKNGHKVVEAEEVYVKVYDKMGSKVKLAFTMDVPKSKETVIVTSYLTYPNRAMDCIKGKPVWSKQK